MFCLLSSPCFSLRVPTYLHWIPGPAPSGKDLFHSRKTCLYVSSVVRRTTNRSQHVCTYVPMKVLTPASTKTSLRRRQNTKKAVSTLIFKRNPPPRAETVTKPNGNKTRRTEHFESLPSHRHARQRRKQHSNRERVREAEQCAALARKQATHSGLCRPRPRSTPARPNPLWG